MSKKCSGCGSLLQDQNPQTEGYIKDTKKDLCERCFRIKNYGDYQTIIKDNDTYMSILQSINKTEDLVLLVVDITNIPRDLSIINQYLSNDQLLVITKRDLLPKSIYDEKLLRYFKGNYIDKIIVSSEKNLNFDELWELINQYKKSRNVYIVGYTNAGKSTMINKLIYNYSDINYELTTSILPSTTLGTVEVKLNDTLTIIDTPGILNTNSIINVVDGQTLKKMTSNETIKPVTYQIKAPQYFMIDKFLMVNCEGPINNSLTFYFANQLEITRSFSEPKFNIEYKKHVIEVKNNNDVVIEGLGFIKVMKATTLTLYTVDKVDIYIREALI